MATVQDLLRSGTHRGLISLVGPFPSQAEIGDVVAVNSLAESDPVGRSALIVWMPGVCRNVEPYQFDVAIRGYIERQHSCLVVMGAVALPSTSIRLAERGRLAVLQAAGERNVADLILWLTRIARGGAAETLARAESALQALAAVPADSSAEELLHEVAVALGDPLELLIDAAIPGPGAVLIEDRLVGTVVGASNDQAVNLVLPAVAAAVSARRRRELEESFASSQTRGELLAQIVFAADVHLSVLMQQARRVSFPVDLNHVASWVALTSSDDRVNELDLTLRRRLVDRAELICREEFSSATACWHIARMGGDLLILVSGESSDIELTELLTKTLERVLTRLSGDEALVYVGLGTAERGISGLRQSAIEARTAADIGRRAMSPGLIIAFDATGIGKVLAELWTSPLSRKIVLDILEPLERTDTVLAKEAVHTLAVYLDHERSPKRSAEVLHLHPNAVRYRIHRIVEVLGVDLGDPDTRFSLHLACRMRDLGRTSDAARKPEGSAE